MHNAILYIVATPIGNLTDISLRAIEILKTVDFIAAEDTRHSKRLCQEYDIQTTMLTLHEHNEEQQIKKLIKLLNEGKSIALISDAGTPLISDPGYLLVNKVREQGIKVSPIPGACAAIAALSASGLPSDRFSFEGFLPAKSGARRQRIEALVKESRTMIFYESPHRLSETLADMIDLFGADRHAVIARELTKQFETIHQDSLENLKQWMENDAQQQRGEFVIMVKGVKHVEEENLNLAVDFILQTLLNELSCKQAAALAAQLTGQRKNSLYQKALAMKAE